MSTLFIKIYDLGKAKKRDELKELIVKCESEKLCKTISSRLGDRNISTVLNHVFDSLNYEGAEQRTRFKMIDSIIKELPKQHLSNAQIHRILTRLTIEIYFLPTQDLVRLTKYCLEELGKDEQEATSWKELLPKLLSLLKEKPIVHHCDSEISGEEYKSQVINSLCMMEWQPNNIIMIADMFSMVPLNEEEAVLVMGKLCQGLATVEPSEVPPLVHQILRVCGDRCCLLLIVHAQQYFASRLNPVATEHDTNTNMSTDLISHASIMETRQSEGTVLFHILEFASLGEKTIKQMLKTVRSLSQAPELIFGGNVLLPSALFMIGKQDKSVFRLLTSAVLQAMQDEEHRTQSFWVRELIQSQDQVKSALENIINETPKERGMVLESMIDWCMELMKFKRTGKLEEVSRNIATLACNVLIHVVKKNRDAIATIVHKLAENIMVTIMVGNNADHFLYCLYHIVQLMPRYLLHSQEFLSFYMVEQLINLSSITAEQIILSLIPLLNLSENLCNSLVIMLSKCLRRPSKDLRQMAVSGLLLMMQKLKTKRIGVGLSQSAHTSAANSCSSQSTDITVHGVQSVPVRKPEVVCLELLQSLRHSLTYQAEVKLKLYQGLLEVSICNPEIAQPALEFLSHHMKTVLEPDVTLPCPFVLEKTDKESLEDDDVVLIEPLGHLLFSVTQMLCEVKQSENTENRYVAIKDVEKAVAAIATKLSQATLHTFGFEEDDMLLDDGAKGSRKLLHLSILLDSYEALIAYCVLRWSKNLAEGDTYSKAITSYHKIYNKISDYQKSLKRPVKKKGDDGSQANNPRKRARPGTSTVAVATIAVRGVKEVGGVKVPPVLNLGTMQLILNLLYNNQVEWATERHAAHVKNKLEFQCWSLNTLLNVLAYFKSQSINKLMDKNSTSFQQLCDVANVLYLKCICNLQEMWESHPDTAALALEAFCSLTEYMRTEHKSLFPIFLAAMCGANDDADTALLVGNISTKLQEFLQSQLTAAMDENDETMEPSTKKLPRMLVSALGQICSVLLPTDAQLYQVVKFLQELVRKQAVNDEQVVRGILELLITLSARKQDAMNTLVIITRHLCHLTGLIDEEEELPGRHKTLEVMKDEHINVAIQVVVSKMRETLDHLTLIIHRLNYERKMVPYVLNTPKDELNEEIKGKERALCIHISSTLEVVEMLLCSAVPTQHSEILLRLIGHLYVTLTHLCRHFNLFSSRTKAVFRGANFEGVVKNAGKQLSSKVSAFITYIEAKNNEKYSEMQGKKTFNVTQATRRVQRDSELIARTVLEMEKFSKAVIQLSNKTKVPLSEHMHLGVSHDFRIDPKTLQNVLATMEEEEDSDAGSGDDNSRSRDGDDSNNTEMRDDDD